jgi:hypothetical protein
MKLNTHLQSDRRLEISGTVPSFSHADFFTLYLSTVSLFLRKRCLTMAWCFAQGILSDIWEKVRSFWIDIGQRFWNMTKEGNPRCSTLSDIWVYLIAQLTLHSYHVFTDAWGRAVAQASHLGAQVRFKIKSFGVSGRQKCPWQRLLPITVNPR